MHEKIKPVLEALNRLQISGVDNAVLLGYAGATLKQILTEFPSQEE